LELTQKFIDSRAQVMDPSSVINTYLTNLINETPLSSTILNQQLLLVCRRAFDGMQPLLQKWLALTRQSIKLLLAIVLPTHLFRDWYIQIKIAFQGINKYLSYNLEMR